MCNDKRGYLQIRGRVIGHGRPVYLVAEMSANHLNQFEHAIRVVEEAKKAGADAIKLQTYTPDSLSLNVENEYFGPLKTGLWKGLRPYELYAKAAMPYEWQPKLKNYAESLGLDCFSSPFDRQAVDFMVEMNMPAFKIASLEITDLPLIRYVASKGRPIMIATGTASLGDLEKAVSVCREAGNQEIALLKCTSQYPAPVATANLRTIPHLRDTFGVTVGLSDHTLGTTVPVAATVLGAQVIEKHFTLDRSMGGPDADFSLEPDEFQEMVRGVREAELALGQVDYSLSEADIKRRRSLFIVKDASFGETLTEKHVRSVRPGYGLAPEYLDSILGRKAARDLQRGEPLTWEMIS